MTKKQVKHLTTPTIQCLDSMAYIPQNITGIGTKMKEGGYATHMVGKWDTGMATLDHTLQGRVFDIHF